MNEHQTLLAALKELTPMEILSLVAQAKTGDKNVMAGAPAGAVRDAKDALEWLVEVLVNKAE